VPAPEALARERSASRRKRLAQLVSLQEGQHVARESLRVAGRADERGLPIERVVTAPLGVGGRQRGAAGERLEPRHPKSLLPARADEDRAVSEEARYVCLSLERKELVLEGGRLARWSDREENGRHVKDRQAN